MTSAYTVRLFPLPNLVLFPGVMQPLYVFELRYREMLEDALAADGKLAIGLLRPGWQQQYDKSPPLHETVCVSEIVVSHKNEDGTSNLLIRGMRRARLLREIATSRSYRAAEVEELPGAGVNGTNEAQELTMRLKRQLVQAKFAPRLEPLALGTSPSLDMLTDAVAYAVPWPLQMKQKLLAETNPIVRAEALIGWLSRPAIDSQAAERPTFPAPESAN
ncbi:MAG: LON peptidase substrate-binding domain-containing protein [Blastopirellula sp. JB062]